MSFPRFPGHHGKNTLTSVSRLPDDILFEIFNILVRDEALPKYDSIDLEFLIQVIPARCPWTLAAVCGRWRGVCLQGAILWSYIEFPEHNCTTTSSRLPKPDNLLLRVLLQLERSRAAPLTIHTNFSCHCECQLAHWRAILSQIHRWRVVRLQMEPNQTTYFQDVLSQLDANTVFRKLERLHFIDNTERPEIVPFPLDGRTVFPNLHSVILRGIKEMDSESDPVGLPWHRLTSLSIHDYYGDFSPFIQTLSQCNSLIDLSFSVGENPSPPLYPSLGDIARNVPKDSVIIPHLTSLTFKNSETPLEKRILPFLRLPSLRYLIFGAVNANEEFNQDMEDSGLGKEPEPCNTLMDFITRSGCVLTELAVHCRTYHEPFARLLTALPQLRFIHMKFDGDASSLQRMLCPANWSYPCSSLEYLRLDCQPWDELKDLVLDTVKSRLDSPDAPHTIKSLRLKINRQDQRNRKEPRIAQTMIEEGLRGSIRKGGTVEISVMSEHVSLDVPRVYRPIPHID